MTKKRKCRPQNYNCGKICIKGTYICRIDGLQGQSVSIANKLTSLIKQTKLKEVSKKPDTVENYKERTRIWQKERGFDQDPSVDSEEIMEHDSHHIILHDIIEMEGKDLVSGVFKDNRKNRPNTTNKEDPGVVEEVLVGTLEGIIERNKSLEESLEGASRALNAFRVVYNITFNDYDKTLFETNKLIEKIHNHPNIKDYKEIAKTLW